MLKRELKTNFKSFIIWSIILVSIYMFVFLIYPSIINSESINMIDEMIKIFPEEVLKALNMDLSSIDSAFGWLKTEGFVFILLAVCSYAGILGSTILLKEENDKTIEYLNSLPIKRNNIIFSKYLCGLIYILLFIIIIALFNYIGLSINEEFDKKLFILLNITSIFPSLVTYTVCMFISTFSHKTKNMIGISLGIVFISYIFNTLSNLSTNIEYLKYISIFTLADIRNVIQNIYINPFIIIISILLILIFLILTIINYNRKELI